MQGSNTNQKGDDRNGITGKAGDKPGGFLLSLHGLSVWLAWVFNMEVVGKSEFMYDVQVHPDWVKCHCLLSVVRQVLVQIESVVSWVLSFSLLLPSHTNAMLTLNWLWILLKSKPHASLEFCIHGTKYTAVCQWGSKELWTLIADSSSVHTPSSLSHWSSFTKHRFKEKIIRNFKMDSKHLSLILGWGASKLSVLSLHGSPDLWDQPWSLNLCISHPGLTVS